MSDQKLAYSMASVTKAIDGIGPKFGMLGELGKDYIHTISAF